MRKLKRRLLSADALRFLKQKRSDLVAAKETESARVKEAKRLWKSKYKDNKTFKEIKEKLKRMAPGIERCMYCEDSAGTDIDHFYPKSTYPLRAYQWENYLLACSDCNSNHKRDRFPTDAEGKPELIDPTNEDPRAHLYLSPSVGSYEALTQKGKQSILVYGLNRENLIDGRCDAFDSVQIHLGYYGKALEAGRMERANRVREILCRSDHISIFIAILDIAHNPAAAEVLEPECLEVLQQYPEIQEWPYQEL